MAMNSPIEIAIDGVLAEVKAERMRQVEREGWTPEHDDGHDQGQLAKAAGCYLLYGGTHRDAPPFSWPWSFNWWKPRDARRDAIRAAAMAIAEIQRLDRRAGR